MTTQYLRFNLTHFVILAIELSILALFFILVVLLPFLIGLITAIRMIFNMVIGKHYPNGDHSLGFWPIFSVLGYAIVSWLFIKWLFLVPTVDELPSIDLSDFDQPQESEQVAIDDYRCDCYIWPNLGWGICGDEYSSEEEFMEEVRGYNRLDYSTKSVNCGGDWAMNNCGCN